MEFMKKYYRIVTLVSFLGLTAIIFYNLGAKSVSKKQPEGLDFSLLYNVRSHLQKQYLEKAKMDDKAQVYGAIKGFVEALGDPYTVFLAPKENKVSEDELKGEFGGVGISLGYKDKNLAVMTPLAKTPAERAGIIAGDLILKIVDKAAGIDKDTAGISLQEAVNLIRGKVGTNVSLSIYREGKDKPFMVDLVREIINVPAVELETKEYKGQKFAWISLYKFTEKLYSEWPELVGKIKELSINSNYGGIVLDLRNNPGGYLESSVMVASDFLNDGVVVTQAGSDGKKQEYKVLANRRNLTKDKLVVLINGGSASAAEILAGALKDYKRGKLLGEKSFGKGTVQLPETFADGSGLHITIAKWLLPSGKNIHKEGVVPDLEIKWSAVPKDSKDMEKVLDALRSM